MSESRQTISLKECFNFLSLGCTDLVQHGRRTPRSVRNSQRIEEFSAHLHNFCACGKVVKGCERFRTPGCIFHLLRRRECARIEPSPRVAQSGRTSLKGLRGTARGQRLWFCADKNSQ